MRLHRSERLQAQWYKLPTEIRAFVEDLKLNPRPQGVYEPTDYPGRREEFVSGRWLIWEIDESTGETIIRVTISE